jgi:hypothetical protein
MRESGLVRAVDRVSAAITRHPVWAFLVTVAIILMLADSARRIMPEEREVNAFTWIALGLIGYAIPASIWFATKRSQLPVLFRWTMCAAPVIYGFKAALMGSPTWVLWLSVTVSICLAAFAALAGRERDLASDARYAAHRLTSTTPATDFSISRAGASDAPHIGTDPLITIALGGEPSARRRTSPRRMRKSPPTQNRAPRARSSLNPRPFNLLASPIRPWRTERLPCSERPIPRAE